MAKIRVGILTLYYDNRNYGGQLQSYALQKTVSKLSREGDIECTAEQISYVNNPPYSIPEEKETKMSAAEVIRKVSLKIMKAATGESWRAKRKLITEQQLAFSQLIPHTSVVTSETIGSLNSDFDVFLCGSDQIWNPGCSSDMLLEFVEERKGKISYAASLGQEKTPPEHLKRLKESLKDFDAVSVRESCHIKLLEEVCKLHDVRLTPDPVFLLEMCEWEKLMDTKKRKPYIFLFMLGDDVRVRNECAKLAKRSGLNMCYIPYLNQNTFLWDSRHAEYAVEAPSVGEFLGLIHDAEAVVTDSFHGSAFSILFGKKLVSLKRFKKGDTKSSNSRIDTLFDNCGLLYDKYCILPADIAEINSTEQVKSILPELRKKGLSFLNESITAAVGGRFND